MPRTRPQLGTPFGTEGPWLAAILDALGDLHDLLDARLPRDEGPARVAEPAPAGGRPGVVPVSEPAPDAAPAPAGPVAEPDPDDEPDPAGTDGPSGEAVKKMAPRRAGRGSSLEAWQAFAELAGVALPEDASRTDIIAACKRAGVIDAE